MKKLLYIILIITLVIPVTGLAQITIGPKVGYNIASQYKSTYAVPKFDWAFGGAVNIPFARNLSVQGEFLVTKKGYREEYNGKVVFDELTATYMEIPAMAKYTINGVNWGYFFQGGVYWGYWSKGEYTSSIDGENIITEKYVFQSNYDLDGFKDVRSDFGAVVEAGVTYDNLGSGVLALGLRYSHGFVATGDYEAPSPDDQLKYNRVFTLSITYFLYL